MCADPYYNDSVAKHVDSPPQNDIECIFYVQSINDFVIWFWILITILIPSKNPFKRFFDPKKKYLLIRKKCSSASETLALLQPIFDSIRADGSSLCSFPLSRTSHVYFRGHSILRHKRIPKVSFSMSHCHSDSVRNLNFFKIFKWIGIISICFFFAQTPHDRSTKSRTASTADSDNSDSHSHGRRTPSKSSTLTTKTSIPIRSSLTPSTSRPASKPASRHGSTLSLASDDGTPTRIPTRKIVGTTFGPPRTPTSTSKPPLSSSASKSRLLSKTPTR